MFYLVSNNLILSEDKLNNHKKKSKREINILNEYINSEKTIPDKDLHNHSILYYPKFNEILSLTTINYYKVETRDTEYLYLELISWWDNYLKINNISKVIFEKLPICPFSFTLFVVLKFNQIKFDYIKKNNYMNFSIYKIDNGNLKKISFFYKFFQLVENIKNYISCIKLLKLETNYFNTKNKIEFDFDNINQLIYFEKNYLNFTQYIDLILDFQNKKETELIFFKQQIFNHKYKKFINSYFLNMIKDKKNLKISFK